MDFLDFPQIIFQDPMLCVWSSCALSLLWFVIFSVFPYFSWPEELWGVLVRHFVKMPLNLCLPDGSHEIKKLESGERECHRGSALSSTSRPAGACYHHQLYQSSGQGCVGQVLHRKVPPHPFTHSRLWSQSLSPTALTNLHYLWLFCRKVCLSIYLFSHLVMSVDLWTFSSYPPESSHPISVRKVINECRWKCFEGKEDLGFNVECSIHRAEAYILTAWEVWRWYLLVGNRTHFGVFYEGYI